MTEYRDAERELWRSVGVAPRERLLHLAGLDVDARVLEAGSGPPVVFLHGSPNAGATWAPLVAHVPGVRAIVVDRPGAGLSGPLRTPVDTDSLPTFADAFLVELLDALELDRAHVVASSFGSYLALRGAAAHPLRVDRIVHLGCPALVEGMRLPPMVRAMVSPLRHVLRRLPASDTGTTMSLRQLGHGASLEHSRIPAPVIAWMTALQSDTDTFRHEGDLMAAAAGPVRGVHPALSLGPEVLAAVTHPTLLVWGDMDPFGGVELGAEVADSLPDATLEQLPDAGHLPWLDDPERCGDLVRAHLLSASRPQAA